MINHTKGAWKIKKLPITGGLAIYADGELIAGGLTEANAQLIASAPKMAEWIERVTTKQGGWIYQADLDEAKDILAKVEKK